MSFGQNFINELQKKLPDLCDTKLLVQLGIFRSRQAANNYRNNLVGPSYFKFGPRRIVYPKEAVIEWVKKNQYEILE